MAVTFSHGDLGTTDHAGINQQQLSVKQRL
jgi:hypothetical protein